MSVNVHVIRLCNGHFFSLFCPVTGHALWGLLYVFHQSLHSSPGLVAAAIFLFCSLNGRIHAHGSLTQSWMRMCWCVSVCVCERTPSCLLSHSSVVGWTGAGVDVCVRLLPPFSPTLLAYFHRKPGMIIMLIVRQSMWRCHMWYFPASATLCFQFIQMPNSLKIFY